ncbi:unnamed protein product [Chondrus crispus]|uniref:Mitochondrial carrier protein n=1 Tax=Chondrus crispus TaxID=2769 RepID=R7QI91_CHOCR|nr:unnamed protein product [Chondrus crispus]CDF37468.1 unnamed protein product [Chondrus crispus]|eukprot:XP_005717287.1 unnamed protein product [Chondrus crispus]
MKRLPTKALTVALFELASQALARSGAGLTPARHVAVAASSGAAALVATYPAHFAYYALRKDVAAVKVLQFARARPDLLYSGAVPALVATAPAVLVDYFLYRRWRGQIDESAAEGRMSRARTAAAIVVAAAAANLTGGFCSEPFKALSRKMAVESVKNAPGRSLTHTARSMMQTGVGEFWRGFPSRSMRYVVSAIVSKATVQQLRRLQRPGNEENAYLQGPHVSLIPAGRPIGPGFYQGRSRQYNASTIVDPRYHHC